MIEWTIEPGLRCDIVMYAAPNLTGKRTVMQSFPGGNRKGGKLEPGDLRSMVVRAPFGTRVTLRCTDGELWKELPWRAIRMVEGHHVPAQRSGGMPGVRIPDLDKLDAPDAKRTARDLQSSYPLPGDETAWSFGQPGALKGRVRAITIEREGGAAARLLPLEALARDILSAVPAAHREEALHAAARSLEIHLRAARRSDTAARVEALRAWAEQD